MARLVIKLARASEQGKASMLPATAMKRSVSRKSSFSLLGTLNQQAVFHIRERL